MNEYSIEPSYYSEINKFNLLTREQEIALAYRIKKGDSFSREEFINANLRLVVKLAKPFSHGNKVLLQDLVQQGNIGLIDAVDNFDPQRGCKFSTFAKKRILAPILDFFKKNRVVSISSSMQKNINRMLHILFNCNILNINTLKSTIRITDEFNARYSSEDNKKYENSDIAEIIKEYSLLSTSSLDASLFNDSTATLIDYVEDSSCQCPQSDVHDILCHKRVMDAIKTLEKLEGDILVRHFGIGRREFCDYKDIELELDISVAKIKEIEAMALRKLRNNQLHLRDEV